MSYSVVILSKNSGNLEACIGSITQNQPGTSIFVVDDGLSSRASPACYLNGEFPFCFARNCNVGIRASGQDDVILMNDDTRLLTKNGFNLLRDSITSAYGIISPGITAAVGNEEQIYRPFKPGLRKTSHQTLVFVCVYIPRRTLDVVGLMDPRFVNYGYCDDDMCARVRREGLMLGVFDGCVVEHGVLPSEYRSGRDQDLEPNRKLFIEKWGGMPESLKF